MFPPPNPTLLLGDHATPAEPEAVGSNVFRIGDTFFIGMYIPLCFVGESMKVQKMVSLDQKTARIASQMTNFSGWIRRMLLLRDQGSDKVAIYRRFTSLMAAVSAIEDEDIRLKCFERYEINQEQKRLGEFE